MARLIDHFPSWMTGGGIFARLGNWTPWASDADTDPVALDLEYFGNVSGYKESAPLIDKMTCYPFDNQMTDVQCARIESILKSKYKKDWDRLWDALSKAYDPISNYDSDETETLEELRWGDPYDTMEQDKGVTITTSGKAKTSSDTTVKDKLIPFGGNAEVEISESKSDSNVEQLLANNEAQQVSSGRDVDTHREHIDDNHRYEKKLTRKGNIGVTTSQQMLESEYELRKKHFFEAVFADLDSVLTAPVWRT